MQRDEVGLPQEVVKLDLANANGGHVFLAHEWVGRNSLHAEGLCLLSGCPSDASEAHDAERLVPQPHDPKTQSGIAPAIALGVVVVHDDATVPSEHHGNDVVGYLVDAVVGNVRDDDAELGSRVHRDVIDTHAVAAYDDAALRRPHDVLCHLGEARHYAVDVPGELDESVLIARGRDD